MSGIYRAYGGCCTFLCSLLSAPLISPDCHLTVSFVACLCRLNVATGGGKASSGVAWLKYKWEIRRAYVRLLVVIIFAAWRIFLLERPGNWPGIIDKESGKEFQWWILQFIVYIWVDNLYGEPFSGEPLSGKSLS